MEPTAGVTFPSCGSGGGRRSGSRGRGGLPNELRMQARSPWPPAVRRARAERTRGPTQPRAAQTCFPRGSGLPPWRLLAEDLSAVSQQTHSPLGTRPHEPHAALPGPVPCPPLEASSFLSGTPKPLLPQHLSPPCAPLRRRDRRRLPLPQLPGQAAFPVSSSRF